MHEQADNLFRMNFGQPKKKTNAAQTSATPDPRQIATSRQSILSAGTLSGTAVW
jgi:hypothetical protein